MSKRTQSRIRSVPPITRAVDEHEPSRLSAYSDEDKWNQIIYEQANRNHLHQDTLRWTLVAGFAAFFVTSMTTINNPQFSTVHPLLHELQFVLVVLGTIYFFIVMIEGWYYNMYLAHLVECEKCLHCKKPLTPVSKMDRRAVARTHPSFLMVLILLVIANASHLWQASAEQWGYKVAIYVCSAYMIVFFTITIRGRVPEWIDRTFDPPRKAPLT